MPLASLHVEQRRLLIEHGSLKLVCVCVFFLYIRTRTRIPAERPTSASLIIIDRIDGYVSIQQPSTIPAQGQTGPSRTATKHWYCIFK